jgi:acyl-CoA thioester hydrolase
MTSPAAPPLCTWREDVREEWIDYNGHLSEAYYVLVLGHATDEVMSTAGLGPAYRSTAGASLFTVEAHIRYLDQVSAGERLEVRSWVIGASSKLLWIWHELYAGGSRQARPTLRATEEILGLLVAGDPPAASPFPDDVAARLHGSLTPPPDHASRSIRVG